MGFVVVTSAILVGYNTATNVLPFPSAWYVPANLGLAGAAVWAARWREVPWPVLGFGRQGVGPGLRAGTAILVVVVAGLLVATLLPIGRALLSDRRVAGIGGVALAYQTLVRIPIGTAFVEEVAFRSVVYGALAHRGSVRDAVIGSSIVFGLWHIGPALDLVAIRQLADATPLVALLVVAAVIGTAAGGAVLALLRHLTGGIVGPVIVHAGTNALAVLAAAWVQR